MKYTRAQFTTEYYKMWQMGLMLPVPQAANLFFIKYRRTSYETFSRVALRAMSVSDALERTCYAVANTGLCRPEEVELQAVYDSEENLLWIAEPFYDLIQKKNEFRGMGRREFLTLFGATSAAALFGLRPSNAFAGTTMTALSGTAIGFPGEQIYITAGSFTWTVPAGVTSACAVCVGGGGAGDDGNSGDGGGGGGAGGALSYANAFTVVPGASIPVVVGAGGLATNGFNARAPNGGQTSITVGSFILGANGGEGGAPYPTSPGSTGGSIANSSVPGGVTTGGGSGGNGGLAYNGGGGGGGAGGYTGAGGAGGGSAPHQGIAPGAGIGTGSGGGGGAAGYGPGSGGTGGASGGTGQSDLTGGGGGGATIYSSGNPATVGGNGNGLSTSGSKGGNGGWPGGGGGGAFDTGVGTTSTGGGGAVRIIWGTGRSFPSSAT